MPNTLYPSPILLANAGQTNQTSTGSALASSSSLTDISPGGNTLGQAFQINADVLQPGTMLRYRANGIYSTTGTPTLLLGLYWGGIAGTALAVTAATTTASGVSNGTWILDATTRVISTGTSGTAVTIGSVLGIAATSANPTLMPATSSNGGQATIDTSTNKIVTVGAQWGTPSSSNTITCYQFAIEILT